MKITEHPSQTKIDIRPMLADRPLTDGSGKPAKHIDRTPWPNKHHCLLYSGCCGSGKTTTMVSLLTSKRHKVYRGVYDTVLVCCPQTTLASFEQNPFEIPEGQFYERLDEQFLDDVFNIATRNAGREMDTCVVVDDAANQLKSNKRIIDALSNLVMKHRHLRLSLHVLIQDIMQCPLGIRENATGILLFKPVNGKRNRVLHDEYFPEFSHDDFVSLGNFAYRQKGDFLFLRLDKTPREYFRNTSKLEIE